MRTIRFGYYYFFFVFNICVCKPNDLIIILAYFASVSHIKEVSLRHVRHRHPTLHPSENSNNINNNRIMANALPWIDSLNSLNHNLRLERCSPSSLYRHSIFERGDVLIHDQINSNVLLKIPKNSSRFATTMFISYWDVKKTQLMLK